MGIFGKTPPDSPEPASSSNLSTHLANLAKERVSAAKRLDLALVEVEKSIERLLDADSEFFDCARKSGSNDHGTGGQLRRVLRTLIVGQMQNAAPQFIKLMGIPYLPARTRGLIADAVARTAEFDIANLAAQPQPKEPAQ